MRNTSSYVYTLIGLMAFATPSMAWVQFHGDAEAKRISGVRNSDRVVTIGQPESDDEFALNKVTWGERSDEPCWFQVRNTDMTRHPTASDTRYDEVNRCEQSGPTERSKRSVGYSGFPNDYTVATQQPVYITGLRVCMNNGRTRIKGIQVEGKQPNPNFDSATILVDLDAIEGVVNSPRRAQSNCNGNWGRWSRCGRNQVVVGLDIHFEGGLRPRSATGIAAQCRKLAREGALTRPEP